MINLSKFAETLEELIFDRGMTAKSLSEALGYEPSTITRYLRGERVPTVDNLVALADYFSCSTDFLLGRTETNNALKFKPCPPFNERIELLLKHFNCLSYKIYNGTGISKSRYYDWKNGKRIPTVDNIIRLAELFDCSTDFILGREN